MTLYNELVKTTLTYFMSVQDGHQNGQVFRMEYENFNLEFQSFGTSDITNVPTIKLTVPRLDPTPIDANTPDELYDHFVGWVTSHANDTKLDDLSGIPYEINKACSRIAMGTRRGAGNFMIIPFALFETCLPHLGNYFAPAVNQGTPSPLNTLPHLVGVANGRMNVFVDPRERTNKIIIGYASGTHSMDTAYIVCASNDGYAVQIEASDENPSFRPARYYETLSL